MCPAKPQLFTVWSFTGKICQFLMQGLRNHGEDVHISKCERKPLGGF